MKQNGRPMLNKGMTQLIYTSSDLADGVGALVLEGAL